MDHESGEKIEILTTLYGLLLKNAIKRNIYYVEFYHLSESVLSKFKMFQGFDPDTKFSGAPLEQAFTIWNQAPLPMIKALFDKNSLSSNELLIHVKL